MDSMLTMLKNSLTPHEALNPITTQFRLGRQTATCGPEMVWKVYDAVRISDGKEASVFLFEKRLADKLHKPRRRDMVTEILRTDVRQLTRLKHPKILRVIHPLEESGDNLAFATVPVLASLANLLGNHERLPPPVPLEIREHSFEEVELKYGVLQIAEALSYLHSTERMVHMNVSPHSILVTKRGMWKLAGLGFVEGPSNGNLKSSYVGSAWTPKLSKMVQPELDYMPPEVQLQRDKHVTPESDMFSLGLLLCALHGGGGQGGGGSHSSGGGHSGGGGRGLIQAQHSPANYARQIEQMSDLFAEVAPRLPPLLVEHVEHMLSLDPRARPSAAIFVCLKYFDDPVARCMQMLDYAETTTDLKQKSDFYKNLPLVLPDCSEKLQYGTIFPLLRDQLEHPDMLELVLPPLVTLVSLASPEQYRASLQPVLKQVLSMPLPVQATVYLLENLSVVLAKGSEEVVRTDVLPMIFNTLESNSIHVQEAAINVFINIRQHVDDQTIRKLVFPKAKALFLKSTTVGARENALTCIDRMLASLDKMFIIEELLPFLADIQCTDTDIVMAVLAIYKHMLSDKQFGLTYSLLATKVMPSLIPHSISPGLNIEQFTEMISVLGEMLGTIKEERLNKMKEEAPDESTLQQRRRTSTDMRYIVYDRPHKLSLSGFSDIRAPLRLTGAAPNPPPDTLTNQPLGAALLGLRSARRHSSYQGLRPEEQTSLLRLASERRRASLRPEGALPRGAGGAGGGDNPHILVSEASVSNFTDLLDPGGAIRRASTQSVGAVIVAEPGRRDSHGRLLDRVEEVRRSSFQGIYESAMNFFVGK